MGEESETTVEKRIFDFLKKDPRIIDIQNNNSKIKRFQKYNRSEVGRPDLQGMFKGGTAFYLEIKKPGGITSKDQVDFVAKIIKNGGEAMVVSSLEQTKLWLRGIFGWKAN